MVKSSTLIALSALVAATTGAAGIAFAQGTPPDLQHIVGWRGSTGQRAMEQRGYVFAHGRPGGDDRSALTFWRNAKSDACVCVTTADGKCRSIDAVPPTECQPPGTKPEECTS
jgi:hypothetical protein